MRFKISILFIIFISFFWFSLAFDIETDCEQRTFVVTAYYSPVSGQAFYYRPNYIEEKILNWNGIAWAAWKKVFNGMLAGPKSYDFWSVIYFPWLGIWEIADRWWAIVNSWERWHSSDRIDIWMWRWEEWLVRALTFGKQTLSWYFCSVDKIKWNNFKIWFNFEQVPFYTNFFDIALRVVKLWSWRNDAWVWTLQKYLIKFWYLKEGKQTWFFGPDTKDALCKYQVAKWILSKKNINCWIFSAPTSFVMKQDVKKKWFYPLDLWTIGTLDNIKKSARNIFKQVEIWFTLKQYFTKSFNKWDKSDDIKNLQTVLSNLWYYTWKINSVFDTTTIDAVYEFQIKNWILSLNNWNSLSKWWLGPATRSKLNWLVNGNGSLLVLKEKNVITGSVTTIVPELKDNKKKDIFQFYRSYKKWDQNWEIRTLQKFLSWEKLYSAKIDWVYSNGLIDALCEFQKKNSLISSKDNSSLCGYLGPKTRELINKKL